MADPKEFEKRNPSGPPGTGKHAKATVRVVNPDNEDDFIVVGRDEFDPVTMEVWPEGKKPDPHARRRRAAAEGDPGEGDGDNGNDANDGDSDDDPIEELLNLTVADLGPRVAEINDPDILAQLKAREERVSAVALIQDRLDALARRQ